MRSPEATVIAGIYPTLPPVEAMSMGSMGSVGASLTGDEMDRLYAYVGVPVEWRADLKAIAWCESQWRFYAVGDSGNSLGGHQLWHGWALAGEDLMDPVTNTWVAMRVREIRGRFGGPGGWACADRMGIS